MLCWYNSSLKQKRKVSCLPGNKKLSMYCRVITGTHQLLLHGTTPPQINEKSWCAWTPDSANVHALNIKEDMQAPLKGHRGVLGTCSGNHWLVIPEIQSASDIQRCRLAQGHHAQLIFAGEIWVPSLPHLLQNCFPHTSCLPTEL